MAPWTAPERSVDRVLAGRVDLESGERITVREFLGGRPTVLAVWATWCPPCLAEKPPMAALQQRLQAAGARAQVKALLAFDGARLPAARARLTQLGAGALENARALESAERALLRLFGLDRQSGSLVTVSHYQQMLGAVLPLALLFDGDATLLGQRQGTMSLRPSYWTQRDTYDFLSQL
jgi:thiol-disulfide isomerase/thioredoxin